MRFRLVQPIDGLEVKQWYDLYIDGDGETRRNSIQVWRYQGLAMVRVKEYDILNDFLADWQPVRQVSEETKQAIEQTIDRAIVRALTELAEDAGYEETIRYESIYAKHAVSAVVALIEGEKL